MFVVRDLQVVELDALEHDPQIFVEYDGPDELPGAHRVSIYGPTAARIIEYVREQFGDEDPEWFQEYVVDRIVVAKDVPVPDLAVGADHSGQPTPGESFVLRLVEDAWYFETKGEIDADEHERLRPLILGLYRSARENIDASPSGQFDRHGREFQDGERVGMEEVANRIARALNIVWFGGS